MHTHYMLPELVTLIILLTDPLIVPNWGFYQSQFGNTATTWEQDIIAILVLTLLC